MPTVCDARRTMTNPLKKFFPREDDDAEQGHLEEAAFHVPVEDKELPPLKRNQTQAERLRESGLSMCGCGQQPKSRDSKFASPGHDRKVEGRIVQAVGGIDELQIIIERQLGRPV